MRIPPLRISGLIIMKFNWGTGVVIAFVLFISFILYFVIKVHSDPRYENDLVVEEYYKHDALFGDEIVRMQNAQDLVKKPLITNDDRGVTIVFPDNFDPKNISGNINFYRSSNKKFDFTIPLKLSSSEITTPKNRLLGGRWEINMEWQYEGKKYLTKETFYVK